MKDYLLGGSAAAAAAYTDTGSWYMYPPGFLLGPGFDTATEVGLLNILATRASHGISP